MSNEPKADLAGVDELVGRLRAMVTNRPDSLGICTAWHRNPDGPEAADRIEALEAKLAEKDALLRECGEALAEYACHGGPDLPCIRSEDQCRTECGKIAGDTLAKIKDATDG